MPPEQRGLRKHCASAHHRTAVLYPSYRFPILSGGSGFGLSLCERPEIKPRMAFAQVKQTYLLTGVSALGRASIVVKPNSI
jgi:hypothetical protein